jgi:transposase
MEGTMVRKRRRYSAEEKVAILKRHLVEREEVSAICEELKLNPAVFYDWQRRFFEHGVRAFEADEAQESAQLRTKMSRLEERLRNRDEVLAELMQEHVALKKSLGEP